MKRSRADAGHRRDPRGAARVAGLLVSVLASCAPGLLPQPPGAPALVVGEWVDSAASIGAETTVWRLLPDGRREIITTRSDTTIHRAVDHWYAEHPESATASARLCFVKRPGRDGASCTDIRLDGSGPVHLRMLLLAPWAQRGRMPPVLLARARPAAVD